jgi:hypothetical protein
MAKSSLTERNGSDSQNTQIKRVVIKNDIIEKILGISSLFRNELPLDAKEGEILGFFLEKGFLSLIESGEIEKKVNDLVGAFQKQ